MCFLLGYLYHSHVDSQFTRNTTHPFSLPLSSSSPSSLQNDCGRHLWIDSYYTFVIIRRPRISLEFSLHHSPILDYFTICWFFSTCANYNAESAFDFIIQAMKNKKSPTWWWRKVKILFHWQICRWDNTLEGDYADTDIWDFCTTTLSSIVAISRKQRGTCRWWLFIFGGDRILQQSNRRVLFTHSRTRVQHFYTPQQCLSFTLAAQTRDDNTIDIMPKIMHAHTLTTPLFTSNPLDFAHTPPSRPAMAAFETHPEASSWLST